MRKSPGCQTDPLHRSQSWNIPSSTYLGGERRKVAGGRSHGEGRCSLFLCTAFISGGESQHGRLSTTLIGEYFEAKVWGGTIWVPCFSPLSPWKFLFHSLMLLVLGPQICSLDCTILLYQSFAAKKDRTSIAAEGDTWCHPLWSPVSEWLSCG